MKCEYCGKQQMSGNKVSHSNIKTRRTQSANIQRVRAIVDGKPKRVQVCTRCLRSGRVSKVA
jgi:large subunit ribosomal protein L28